MQSIILIEPHAFMRQALASRLRLIGYEPLICESLEEAMPRLHENDMGYVICPLELGQGSGLDLLWWLRSRGKQTLMLLMSENEDPVLAQALSPYGCHLMAPHPAHLANVFKRLQESEYQLRFKLDAVSLSDLIQLLTQANSSTHLYVADPETGAEGLVFFEQGRIKHAVYDVWTGEEAFFKIMGLKQGLFMETDFGRPEYYSIDTEIPHLLARSAVHLDENLSDFSPCFSGQMLHLSLFDCLQIFGNGPRKLQIVCRDALNDRSETFIVGHGRLWQGVQVSRCVLEACLGIQVGEIRVSECQQRLATEQGLPLTRLLMDLALLREERQQLPENLMLSDGRILQPFPEHLQPSMV